MTARVLVVGLDAGDPTTAQELAADGRMPALARLLDQGARHPIAESGSANYVAERWTTMVTGVVPATHRYLSWATYDPTAGIERPAPLDPVNVARVWDALGAAGLRVAVLDVPRQPLSRVNGVQLCEWGTHDRDDGVGSWPPNLLEDIEARFGPYPLDAVTGGRRGQFAPCDMVVPSLADRSNDRLRRLAELLEAAVDVKARVSEALLGSERWDLCFTVFGESHCAAHHFWHLHRPSSPRDRESAALLGDVVTRIYERIDASLLRHVELAGPDATTVVVLHTGMRHLRDTVDLLQDVLQPVEGSSRRFSVLAFSSHVGAIRLHVAGRDRGGPIDPSEVPRVVDDLRALLLGLVDDDTGRRAVRAVRTRAEVFPDIDDDTLPDVFVDWDDEATLARVSSPMIGSLGADARFGRSGDHSPDGMVVVHGPGIAPGVRPPIDAAEVARLIASAVGLDYRPAAAAEKVTASTSSE